MDDFTRQYIETALWSSTDDEGEPLDGSFTLDNLHPDTVKTMTADCKDFQESFGDMIDGRDARAGHDFWLTRNGHGAGFWDGDWPKHGDKLTEMSKPYGECNLYIGDDNQIYIA